MCVCSYDRMHELRISSLSSVFAQKIVRAIATGINLKPGKTREIPAKFIYQSLQRIN